MICIFGDFELDEARHELRRGGAMIATEPKVFVVLLYLLQNRERVISKGELLEQCWPGTFVSEWALTRCLTKLRRAVRSDRSAPAVIKTVHGRGYRFVAPVRLSSPEPALPSLSPPAAERWQAAMPNTPSTAARQPAASRRSGWVVGREAALEQLQKGWEKALGGERQIVFVTGEAGIGKTALMAAFVEQAQAHAEVWIGHGQCIDHYGAGEAYLPVLEALERLCRGPNGAEFIKLLGEHAPTWLVQMPTVLSAEEREFVQGRSQGATQERMLRELAEAVVRLTAIKPLVLVLEDLHWSDPSTLALLALLARRPDEARLLVVGTYRPVEVMLSKHPVRQVVQELLLHEKCDVLPLRGMTLEAVQTYLSCRCEVPGLMAELARVLHQRTEGNPLFGDGGGGVDTPWGVGTGGGEVGAAGGTRGGIRRGAGESAAADRDGVRAADARRASGAGGW